ncbi:LysR family transcriptional regulator [Halieaceae bacterium IMCC14734]|uniref:LysR family transcriptional regulator n=1 Tax=Candidatus Litorirhabdus singularis TaxID=2518993 RepID=A0ABT3TNH8_9GAMM|nr:LysR family transcriptional regulator [Candidatus Litorirhabdus singularis]MCX2982862.1 LysR family transcriptional regulator [Candidatus Litorirhabdus singularis]
MDRFHQLQVYVAVAEQEGFAAAARRLQLSPPAVTRAVAALEDTLGVKLLDRTTRHVRVTEAGRRYLDDARQILAGLEAADDAAAGINAEPRGHLAVTAPVMFGRLFVMPGIVDYLEQYPGMEVEAVFLDRSVNLLEEGLDVGVRIGELPDSSMRALRVGSVHHVLVATPAYLARHGTPQVPQDLRQHSLIASAAGGFGSGWRFSGADSDHPLKTDARLTVTSNDAAISAALAGFGIARQLSYQVTAEIEAGALQILLPQYQPADYPVHIVHRESRHASARVRAFIDLLAQRLRGEPCLHDSG